MRHTLLLALALAALAALLLTAAPLRADEPRDFGLTWWTVDGGGGTLRDASGRFTLSASIGQPDAGPRLGGGVTAVSGGFWATDAPPEHRVFLPSILRRTPGR